MQSLVSKRLSLALFVAALAPVLTMASMAQAATLSVQSLSPGSTVANGNEITFSLSPSGFNGVPNYSITDTLGGSSVSSSDINQNTGLFVWIPSASDAGMHTLTISADDGNGGTASVSQQIIVTGPPSVSIQSLSPGTTVLAGQTVNFNTLANGSSALTYSVTDPFAGSSLISNDINQSGSFSWTPLTQDVGTHTITVTVTDASGNTANTSQTITVIGSVGLSMSAVSPSSAISPGQTLSFTVTPSGLTNPAYIVTDSYGASSVSNLDINSSGAFSWTPNTNDVGTHTITVTATDSYGHIASVSTQATVSVTATTPTTTTTTMTPVVTSTVTTTTTEPASFTFSTYLSPGITSDDVTELQTVLTQQGVYSGPITGYYGSLTEAGVIAFQAAHGIDQLGVVGPATRAALNALTSSAVATPTTTTTSGYVFANLLDLGSSGADVTALQQKLTSLGIYSGPVTGYFGALTQAAVETFQGQNSLEQVGYVGPGTRAALNK